MISSKWIFLVIYLFVLGKSIAQEKRIVCYYTNWSIYRGKAGLSVQDISPTLCTHLIYAYGRITDENTIEGTDNNPDIKNKGFTKFTGLKTNNVNLKTLLSLRSNDKTSKFSPLVGNNTAKPIFIENAINFLRKYNFDGLDLDWQHPTFGNESKPEDRANYAKFVQELREAFEYDSVTTRQTRLLLTLTVPKSRQIIDQGYDVERLSQYSDWLNLVAYNYYNQSSPTTKHHAPLYTVDDQDPELNANFSVNYLINAGADRQKLVMGIPTYGVSYTLLDSSVTGVGAPTVGPGKAGNGTGAEGTLAYFEICQNIISNSWAVIHRSDNASGSYSYKGDQWVGYDDEKAIQNKVHYVVNEGLGGISFWSLDLDDFQGGCSGNPFSLINAAKIELIKASSINENKVDAPIVKPVTKSATQKPPTPIPISNMKSETVLNLENDFKCDVVGFYPHPTDCKKYIYCKLSETINSELVRQELTCPSSLLFNSQTNVCDYAKKAVCLNSITPDITTESPPVMAIATESTPTMAIATESTPAMVIATESTPAMVIATESTPAMVIATESTPTIMVIIPQPITTPSTSPTGRSLEEKIDIIEGSEVNQKLLDYIKMTNEAVEKLTKSSVNNLGRSEDVQNIGKLSTPNILGRLIDSKKLNENNEFSAESESTQRKFLTIHIHNSNVSLIIVN